MRLVLTSREFAALSKAPVAVAAELSLPDGQLVALVPNDSIEELRQWCMDTLQIEGFDLNYEPNDVGCTMESLIHKLYVP